MTGKCLHCGSRELEEWGESGEFWVHCHGCDRDLDSEEIAVTKTEDCLLCEKGKAHDCGDLVLSASQFKTFERCPRLWWWEKVRKMPRGGQSYSQTFGKVIHSVLERYLGADAAGRDSSGSPVNLYPEGWQTDPESEERILPQDEEVVKELVELAVADGVVARRPDTQTEIHFLEPLIEGAWVQGYIDVDMPDEIQDHKSTSSMRWALSKEKLAEDTQMLLYAKIRGAKRIRHNVFARPYPAKDVPCRVKKVGPVDVTPEQLQTKWEELQALARDMKALKELDLSDEDFEQVKADYPSSACNMYRGCSYIYVCGGEKYDTPAKYRARKLPQAA